MAMTIKSFGVALLAGSFAICSVISLPATTYAASNQTSNGHRATTTPPGLAKKQTPSTETAPSETTSNDEATPPTTYPTGPQTLSTSTDVPSAAAKRPADPAGNNGTVKIDRTPFDSHPDNQPHVTCSFQVDFYGYDQGVGNAQVIFELQPPTKDGRTLTVTSGNLTPNIGHDAASGGTDVDAQETYTLGFTGATHDKQGYHVKLTVHAPGSQGADVKHKVFWVQPCAAPATPTTPTTPKENGQILGTTTSKPAVVTGTLPASLPSTGLSTLQSLLVILLLSALTYASTYWFQLRRFVKA